MIKLAVTVFAAFALSCSSSVPEGWRTFDARGRFRFSMPPEMELVETHGIDSYVRAFESPSMRLTFDCGMYPSLYRTSPVEYDTINGVEAKIYRGILESVPVDSLSHWMGMTLKWNHTNLGISIRAKTAEDLDVARLILASVCIQKDPGKRRASDGWMR